MNIDEYLKQSINPGILEEIREFKNSEAFKDIEKHLSSDKFQDSKEQLKFRDKNIHKTILLDIQRLQDNLI